MKDRFEELLEELGKIFELSLHPDSIGACSIQILPHLKLQIQLDTSQENVFLFSKIIQVPPGRFQEEVMKEALKTNNLPDPRPGTLGFFDKSSHLTLHQLYPLSTLNGDQLAGLIGAFIEMVELWYQAIDHGKTAPIDKKIDHWHV